MEFEIRAYAIAMLMTRGGKRGLAAWNRVSSL
jgi:hypothetical protein